MKVTDSGGTRYFLYDGGMPVLELDENKKITALATSTVPMGWSTVGNTMLLHTGISMKETGQSRTMSMAVTHGTLGGGEAAKVPAWSFGCGLLFDGVDDLVKVPDSDGLDLSSAIN